jgi:hypothetical protein
MRVAIKLISLFLLSSLAYSKIITNSVTISYLFGDESHFYQKDSNISVLDKSQNGDALRMIKTAQKKYKEDNITFEVKFNIEVTVNRDISELIIGDEIVDGFIYQDGSLLLNGISPSSFLLFDSALSLSIGDVKEGEVYTLSYIVKEKINSD